MELIKFLYIRGADMTTADEYDATPLHYAIEMCEQQQQQQQQQDDKSNEMCRDNDVVDQMMCLNVLRAVLMRTDIIDLVDQQHRTPLIWAASCGNLVSIYYAQPYKGGSIMAWFLSFHSSISCLSLTHTNSPLVLSFGDQQITGEDHCKQLMCQRSTCR